MLDFKVSLFLALHILFTHFLYFILFPVTPCSLLNTLSVSLEMAPPDMRHIVRRDCEEHSRMDVGTSPPAGLSYRYTSDSSFSGLVVQ